MPISLQEISEASKHLKDNKTSADGWIPRMITAISGTLFGILLVLFNIIPQCALYPTRWRTSMAAAIFKNKGSHLSANFYRPTSTLPPLNLKDMKIYTQKCIRLRLSSHSIETGHWSRTKREERLCEKCGVSSITSYIVYYFIDEVVH